jgi:hypothetical protein
MALESYSFAAIGEGTTATATNMGSATLIAPTPGTGGTITGAFAAGMFSNGAKFTCGTTATCLVSVTTATPALAQAHSFYYLMPSTAFTVKTAIDIIRGGVSGTPGPVARVNVGTDWSLEAQGQAFSGSNTFGAAGVVAANTWYRFEVRCIAATSTTGTFKVSVYPMFGTAAQITTAIATFSSTTYNCGTDVLTRYDLGICSTQTAALTVGVSNLTIDNAQATTEVGGWVQSVVSGSTVGAYRDYSTSGTVTVTGTLSPNAKLLSDASDATSVTIGTTGSLRVVLPKMATPAADTWVPTVKQHLLSAGTGTFQLKVYDTGGTLRKTYTLAPNTGALTNNVALTPLTAGEVATFNNFDAVSLELVRT